MSAVIRTVRGDITATDAGITDAHDHLLFRSAALPGHELDDPALAAAELASFAAAGGGLLVHWTPHGLGADPAALVAASLASGVHVVAATGRHRREHYPGPIASAFPADPSALAALFSSEVADALVEQPAAAHATARRAAGAPRAGVIKIAAGYHRLDDWERTSLEAAAEASVATGAPICVHLEGGTHGEQVLEHLGARGVPASRVILGHLTRSPDGGYHHALAATGAYLAYDGPSRGNHATDWRLFELLHELAGAGHLGRLLLGADTTTRGATSTAGAGPGMAGLLALTGARVRRDLGEAAHEAIFRANPARAFALR